MILERSGGWFGCFLLKKGHRSLARAAAPKIRNPRGDALQTAVHDSGQVDHPAFGGRVRFRRERLPDNPDLATAATIERMAEYAREDSAAVEIARLARSLGGANAAGVAGAIWAYIRARVRFAEDTEPARPLGGAHGLAAEVLIRPVDLVRMPAPAGDCDDFSMLAAALFLARGIACEFVTVAADGLMPDEFSHVYVQFWGGRDWVPFDSSHGPYVGWEVDNRYNKRAAWPLDERVSRMLGQLRRPGLGSWADGLDWGQIINRGIDIVGSRYGTPVTYEGPGGVIVRSPTPGAIPPYGVYPGSSGYPPMTGTTSFSPLLLLGLGLLVVVMVAKK